MHESFNSLFNQANRLLELTLPPEASLSDDTLLPYELTGAEEVSSGFTYTLTCLSSNAFLELKDLIGLPVQLAILTDDGSKRALCGIVTAAELAGGDGSFSKFVLTLQDPMAVLAKRINSRVFQDLSVCEFTAILLKEHQQRNAVLAQCFVLEDRCQAEHPKQSWVTQFNESDAAFLARWFAQEGISWYIEHGDAGSPEEAPKMTLVLFDDVFALEPASVAKVRFHRDDGTENEDTITAWQGKRSLQPRSTMSSSYEYKAASLNVQQDENKVNQGDFGQRLATTLEDNRFDTHHSANDCDDFARYGKLRAQAYETAAKFFSGVGTHRELAVGCTFELTQHPIHDHDNQEDRQFTITRHELYARNNLPADLLKTSSKLLQPSLPANVLSLDGTDSLQSPTEPIYRTCFDAVRKHVPIVPVFSGTAHAKPTAPSLMTAIVVGPPGEEIHTNEFGCIKVRMPFTRAQDQAHAEGAGASNTDQDSLWIRVAQRWTGHQYGQVFLPRVGDEVLIQFINDDIDRPIVIGSAYNGTHRPATFSDAGNIPGNKALSGIKSKMVRGSGSNEIIWDDSTGEQRIRIATDHTATALNQGYLVHPRSEGKGEPRGEGFDLHTDAYGVLRAAKGMLITTDAREHARSTHLDSKELTTQLAGSIELAKALSDAAQGHNAHPLDVNKEAERLQRVAQATTTQHGGTGQQATVPAYQDPILAFSSPAGIVSATPKTQQIAAGEHLHLTSQQDTNLAVGERLAMAVKEAWSVFVATSGIKLFAGKGKVEIQAQGDALEMTAKQDVKITSVDGEIDIVAPKEIRLTAGGCQIKLSGGSIDIKAPGPVNIHGSVKNFAGPAKAAYPMPHLPQGAFTFNDRFVVRDPAGDPVANARYVIEAENGKVFDGTTDELGRIVELKDFDPKHFKIRILPISEQ